MKLKRTLCTVLLCAFTLCGCEETDYFPSEIVVSDSENSIEEEAKPFPAKSCGVTLEKAVEKAVSLSPATTEIICELGFGGKLIAVSDYCDYPENLTPTTVGSTENPDIDAIIKLKPDAVFTLSLLSEREIYKLNTAGIAVLTPEIPASIEDYSSVYKEIAAAFYGREIANADKGELKTVEIAKNARLTLEKAAKDLSLESFVYVTEKLTIAGAETFEGAVLGLCGENLCVDSGYVAASGCEGKTPAYIIADDKLTKAKIKSDKTLAAMLNGGAKLVFVTSTYLERPTARTAIIFSQISQQLDDE